MNDISKAVTLDAKQERDLIYVLGTTKKELGGSEYYAHLGYIGNSVPTVDAEKAIGLYQKLSQAMEEELCHSVHTPAFGGLGIGFAKMAIAGRLGMNIDLSLLSVSEKMEVEECLFSESNSRFIVTIPEIVKERFEDIMEDQPISCVGKVVNDPCLSFFHQETIICRLGLEHIIDAYKSPLANLSFC